MVVWVIGMSSSGKTAFAKSMYQILKTQSDNWMMLDGDMVRSLFNDETGHDIAGRRQNGERIQSLCKNYEANGFHVLACVLSIFPEHLSLNRKIYNEYKEIYIKCDLEKLVERDSKHLYKCAMNGEIMNVVGVDIEFPEPTKPDVIIDNNQDYIDLTMVAVNVVEQLNLKVKVSYEYTRDNRLLTPHKYEFSRYEGKVFIESFLSDRKQKMNILEMNFKKLVGEMSREDKLPILTTWLDDIAELVLLEGNVIRTKATLAKMLTILLQESIPNNMDFGICLLKKFDVVKRIYSKYMKDTLQKANDDYLDIDSYLLLANVMALYVQRYTRDDCEFVIMTNALLKLNDTISSAICYVCTPYEIILAERSFQAERTIVSRLAKVTL